jgi:hypothetical protein
MNLVTMKKSDSVVTKYATVKNQMHIMTLNNQMKKKTPDNRSIKLQRINQY